MPTYEYRCESCGNTFDVVQSFADDPLTTCERCGGALRKVYAPVGIVFKGSGFYKTDSRGSSTATKPSTTPASTTSPQATAESSGPAKTAESSKDAPAKTTESTKPAATPSSS